jgi:hypothetical protein
MGPELPGGIGVLHRKCRDLRLTLGLVPLDALIKVYRGPVVLQTLAEGGELRWKSQSKSNTIPFVRIVTKKSRI